MSGLAIKITADAASAIQQFNALAGSSEELGAKMEKANQKFASEHISRFIDRQKLAQAAVTAAQGSTEALVRSSGAYQREIERLIKQGLSPESAQIKRLQSDYAGLQKQLKAVANAHEDHAKSAEKSARALANGANFTVIYRFLKESIEKVGGEVLGAAAKVEDMTAAFTPMLGSADKAASLVKRINTEAASTPFEIESISNSVKRLLPAFQGSAEKAVQAFRMIGDTAGGNAQKLDTITNAYTKVMLTGKVGMEALNSIAGAGVPIFTELAASMGVTVTELSDMSSKGKITSDDLAAAFQRMTSEGGIFFKGMETSSDTFNMRVLGLKENIGILAGAIGEKLLPQAKDMAGKAAAAAESLLKWAQDGENLDRTLAKIGTAAAAAAAGITVFVLASKGYEIVTVMAGAAKLLMTTLTGPAGIAALAVGALVAGIGLLINHAQEAGRQFREQSEAIRRNAGEAAALLDAYGGLNPSKTLDKETTEALIKLYPELTGKIRENITTVEDAARMTKELASNKAAEAEMEGPFYKSLERKQFALRAHIEKLKELAAEEKTAAEGIAEAGRITSDASSSRKQIENAESALEMYRGQLAMTRAEIVKVTADQDDLFKQVTEGYAEMNKRLAEYGIGINTLGIVYTVKADTKQAEKEAEAAAASMVKTFVEKVKATSQSQSQVLGDQINQIKSFINQRAELEQAAGTNRIAAIKNIEKQILENESYTAEERAVIAKAAAKALEEAQKPGGGSPAPKPEKEDTRFKDMMEQMRQEIAETGKSERELAEMRAFAAGAADEQTEAYMRMYDHLQRLKDAAEYEKQRLKDTEEIKNQTQGYIEKLAELRIKNDEIKNDEAQLLEIRRAQAIGAVMASKADDDAKAQAIERQW